ncbi:MAG: metal-dependent transcriptional regulator [Bacteroidota bacterium]
MKNKKISASLEDYLETIYEIIQKKHGVKAVEISRHLCVSRSSVTEALKNLADKKLVNYGRYDVISLTAEGEKRAKEISLKHHTLYEFLTDVLGIDPEEAQENACRIEHVISDDVLKKLLAFVDFSKNVNCHNKNYLEKFQKFYEEVNYEDLKEK